MREFNQFISDILIPKASLVLSDMYARYCSGSNIGIKIKSNNTPATIADREAEILLRDLIMGAYPDHGIWGEEYGGYQLNSPYIWVLDPLDGTKAFLNKQPNHFGILVGLLHDGIAIAGGIADPLNGKEWLSIERKTMPISSACVACTAAEDMFGVGYTEIFQGYDLEENLNCIGFAKVADGSILAAVEQNLALHDIIALIPVLVNSGAYVFDLQGKNYATYLFDINQDKNKKFGLITSFDISTIKILLERINS